MGLTRSGRQFVYAASPHQGRARRNPHPDRRFLATCTRGFPVPRRRATLLFGRRKRRRPLAPLNPPRAYHQRRRAGAPRLATDHSPRTPLRGRRPRQPPPADPLPHKGAAPLRSAAPCAPLRPLQPALAREAPPAGAAASAGVARALHGAGGDRGREHRCSWPTSGCGPVPSTCRSQAPPPPWRVRRARSAPAPTRRKSPPWPRRSWWPCPRSPGSAFARHRRAPRGPPRA